jgi:hypothetical protein
MKNALLTGWNRLVGRDIAIKSYHRLLHIEAETRIAAGMARASATASLRHIDPTNPETWEFAGFSQHGEDGILDYLCSRITVPNRFFFEIGAADGLENCTAWLALARGYSGVMIEGDPELSACYREIIQSKVFNVHLLAEMVTAENILRLMKFCPFSDPDVFSIDIDGIDFYVLKAVLNAGFRPKVIVAEYNSAFGPDRAVTIPYRPDFARWQAHPTGLYYGVSITAWRTLLAQFGYRFVTTETSGTNGFFLDPTAFETAFVEGLRGVDFRENAADQNGATRPQRDAQGDWVLPMRDSQAQFAHIQALELVDVASGEPA